MSSVQTAGAYKAIVKAPSPRACTEIINFGITAETFRRYKNRPSFIAQYYRIVQPELIFAISAFRGLQRPAFVEGNENADKTFLAYTLKPDHDYEWEGTPYDGEPQLRPRPHGCVFVVIIREEKIQDGVFGSILYWSWVEEDVDAPGSPVEHGERYLEKLWDIKNA